MECRKVIHLLHIIPGQWHYFGDTMYPKGAFNMNVNRINELIDQVHGNLAEMRSLIQTPEFDGRRYGRVNRLWHAAQDELDGLLPPNGNLL